MRDLKIVGGKAKNNLLIAELHCAESIALAVTSNCHIPFLVRKGKKKE